MTTRHLAPAFGQLRRLLARPDAGDAQLLQRFVNQGDESAFEILVRRHGAMVHGVCRRVLRDAHDAEDAFQATLLVLARKAGSIGDREALGPWLYKVAYRVALRARDGAWRRACRERQVPELLAVADPRAPAGPAEDDLRGALDEELSRLAEKHRSPVVLCYLEGLTNEEAARRLRCPVGTVKTRLAQARRLLGDQLARRGLTLAGLLTAGATATLLASPPEGLIATTVRAAALAAAGKVFVTAVPAPVACLTEGVLRAMMVTKLKLAAVALATVLAVAGVGGACVRAFTGGGVADERSEPPAPARKATPAEARVKQLKQRMSELAGELRRAEEAAAREKAVPPRESPVAVIFGDVPITRDELADHLLSRMTTSQLEGYLNRRILEHACKKAGVAVTDAEVDAHLKAELKKGKLQEEAFLAGLREQRKTLREWKEDVLRPQLQLQKLAREGRVTEKALRDEFEARYGEKVECQVLVWEPGQQEAAKRAASLLRTGEATFEDLSQQQKHGARVVTINRQRTKERAVLEEAAFALEEGEVSPVIDLDRRSVILRCRRRIPADTATRFEDVRECLKREVGDRLLRDNSASLFSRLKAEARPRLLWAPPDAKERGER